MMIPLCWRWIDRGARQGQVRPAEHHDTGRHPDQSVEHQVNEQKMTGPAGLYQDTLIGVY